MVENGVWENRSAAIDRRGLRSEGISMVRINTLNRNGRTLTIELMGYINKTEFDILHDCMESYVEEGVREVCIVANEVRSISPLLERDVIGLGQLGLTLHFQQLAPSIQRSLKSWGLQAWIDDE